MEPKESYHLKECPNCGADVEGLIHHCDCCGELLYPKETLFSYMVYEAGSYFDIQLYLNKIFDKLSEVPVAPYQEAIRRIEFDFWCYPIKKKPGATYYSSRKSVIATIRLDNSDYIFCSKQEKMELLVDEMQSKIDILEARLRERKIDCEELFKQIKEILENARNDSLD